MWLLIIFASAFAQGTLVPLEVNEISKCEKPLHRVCNAPDTKDFPETPEEVDLTCRNVVSFHHCATDYMGSCYVDEDMVPGKSFIDKGVFLELCDKSSAPYKMLVDNAKCIAQTLKDIDNEGLCRRHMAALELETPDIRDQIYNIVSDAELKSDTQLEKCLDLAFGVGCLGVELNRNECDQSTFDLLAWFLVKSEIANTTCKEEYKPIIEEFVTLMKFEKRK